MLHRKKLRCSLHFLLIFIFAVIAIDADEGLAQVSIKERISIIPTSGRGSTTTSYYTPCNPPPSDPQNRVYQAAFFPHPYFAADYWIGATLGQQYGTGYTANVSSGRQYIHLYLYAGGTYTLQGYDNVSWQYGWGQDLCVSVDGSVPTDSAVTTISVTDSWGVHYTINLFIVKPMYHLYMYVMRPDIPFYFPGSKEVPASLWNQCWSITNLRDTIPNASYTASIISGTQYGVLVNSSTNDTGTTLSGLRGVGWDFQFLANKDNPDSVGRSVVRIWASDTNVSPDQDTVVILAGPAGPFAKFRVTFNPDTVLHGDTTAITVVAVDSNNHQVVIPDTTHLIFSIDSVQYATFINATGDSVPSPLTGILYSDARMAKIKLVADGLRPTFPGPKSITLTSSGGGKTGQGTVFLDPIRITIALARNPLHPLRNDDNRDNPNYNVNGPDKRKKIIDFSKLDTTAVTITLTNGQGLALKNYPIVVQGFAKDSSGGHVHVLGRPTGRFIDAANDTLARFSERTGSDGIVRRTYLCSGFGGIDSMVVWAKDPKDTSTCRIELKIPGLQSYTRGSNDTLIGWTPIHTVNHYATSNTISYIRKLADSAYAVSYRQLQLNDMSLCNGGPFDIDTTYRWNTPHEHHREGTNLDMRVTATNGKAITEAWLKRIVKTGWNKGYQREGNPVHYHLSF